MIHGALAVDSCASFSRLLVINILDTTEETFAGRILISATDPLKRQLATIRDRGSPGEPELSAGVAIARPLFNKL